MSKDYHGQKPVTDEDKKMGEDHLKKTNDLLDDQKDLLKQKIKDHKDARKARLKAGDKKSANYHAGHIAGHEKDLKNAAKDEEEIHRSLNTLKNLHTHSRKTYNDVRKAKVNLMYAKTGAK